MEKEDRKRLFFAFEMEAPWPEELPKGRMLDEKDRHLTVAFLGHTNYSLLHSLLETLPTPPFKVGLSGKFDKVVFLPKTHPRVVAWHISKTDHFLPLENYRRQLIQWLQEKGFSPDDREDQMFHTTLCRAPFEFEPWREAFQKLPFFLKALHLYESMGQLHYEPRWSHPFQLPFEEFEHTADIAFKIKGENIADIFLNALTALAFKSPELLRDDQNLQETLNTITTIDDVIIKLNERIAYTDSRVGCPFKAVSFHGNIKSEADNTLTWEMIVDV